MNTNYIINDCGVCVNPTIIFRHQKKNALAWNYVEINYAQFPNGKWDFGYSCCGGGSSPSLVCANFSTKEEAINTAKDYLKSSLKDRIENFCSGYMVSVNDYVEYLKEFIAHESKQQQLTLF